MDLKSITFGLFLASDSKFQHHPGVYEQLQHNILQNLANPKGTFYNQRNQEKEEFAMLTIRPIIVSASYFIINIGTNSFLLIRQNPLIIGRQ